jgi:hypothetical protein
MRKSTGDLIWDFIVLSYQLRAFKKIHEYEEVTDHCFDESVIAAICEYQLSLPLKEFMATGFVGRAV